MAAAARPSNPVTWPEPYDSSGVAANDFTRTWHTHEEKLAEELSRRYNTQLFVWGAEWKVTSWCMCLGCFVH